MPEAPKRLSMGVRLCAHCVLTFALWTAWLVLSLLLAFQLYIAATNRLEVPAFLLHALEDRLAQSGAHVRFGKATFDPSGRILIENAKLNLDSFSDPIVTARAVYGTIDPWGLIAGRFEPKELVLVGVSLYVPAMLSPSGKSEETIRDLDAGISLGGKEAVIDYLYCRLGGVALSAHGTLHVGNLSEHGTGALPLTEFLARNYPALSRQIGSAISELSVLERPVVRAEFTASETRAALVRVVLDADGLAFKGPPEINAGPLRLVTRFPLLGDAPVAAALDLNASSLESPAGEAARNLRIRLRGTLKPSLLIFTPRELDVGATEVNVGHLTVTALSSQLRLDGLTHFQGSAGAWVAGSPVALQGKADLADKTAAASIETTLGHGLVSTAGDLIGKPLTRYVDPIDPIRFEGAVALGKGWSLEKLTGRIDARATHVYGVDLSSARGVILIDPSTFAADDIYLGIADDYAVGSYTQDLASKRYRFLLDGKLRPLDISGWFREWWPNFFRNLAFPDSPPKASVDVQGQWTNGYESNVYVFMDAAKPVIRSVPFDRARTRLFIRPFFYDGIELYATQGPATVQGTFRRVLNPANEGMLGMDFDLTSSLPLSVPVQMFGAAVGDILRPYGFDTPPDVHISGHLDGASSPSGAHHVVHLDVASKGVFRLFGFPIDRAKAHTEITDDAVTVTDIDAVFAGGTLVGKTTLGGMSGSSNDQTLMFDGTLTNASLGQAVTTIYGYEAYLAGRPAPPVKEFAKGRTSVRLDLSASATGKLRQVATYSGSGKALVQGPELGEVRMLGLLSQVLKMTSLRFTTAKADFTIANGKIIFPEVSVTGANSAIQAQGSYMLARSTLDFNAKIFPFQESKSLIKQTAGIVLAPFSSVFEMKLSGSLENPSWSPLLSPFNLLKKSEEDTPVSPAPALPAGR